tara:strand:+ start:4372 stop:4722 length:351 start_codon:yes stop_codon:yes gene_type:complete
MIKNKVKKEIIVNIEGITEKTLKELDEFIQNNIGLTSKELVSRIDFYSFTEESLEYILDVINKNPCSFNEFGPFMKKGEKWYNKKKMKKEMIIELKEENINLRQELNRLKKLLGSQ